MDGCSRVTGGKIRGKGNGRAGDAGDGVCIRPKRSGGGDRTCQTKANARASDEAGSGTYGDGVAAARACGRRAHSIVGQRHLIGIAGVEPEPQAAIQVERAIRRNESRVDIAVNCNVGGVEEVGAFLPITCGEVNIPARIQMFMAGGFNKSAIATIAPRRRVITYPPASGGDVRGGTSPATLSPALRFPPPAPPACGGSEVAAVACHVTGSTGKPPSALA